MLDIDNSRERSVHFENGQALTVEDCLSAIYEVLSLKQKVVVREKVYCIANKPSFGG